RVQPATLRVILIGGAVLLLALALMLAAPVVRRLVPKPRDERTPLQRALDLVRASLRGGEEDRRRALDVLGRTLPVPPQSREALELAWSQPEPEPARVAALLEEVEQPQ